MANQFLIELLTKEGTPFIEYQCQNYWISQDGALLHLRTSTAHHIIPFSNILHFSALSNEA